MKSPYHINEYLYEQPAGSLYDGVHLPTNEKVLIYCLSFDQEKCNLTRWSEMLSLAVEELKAITSAYSISATNCFIDENGPHIVMAYEEVTPLRHFYTQPMSYSTLRNFISQSLKGLNDIHDQGHVHGGISPESFVVSTDDDQTHRYKIIDLFIKELIPSLNGWAVDAYIPSHPAILPPEFFEGELIDNRSDIYMLGQTFYYMALAGHPFVGLENDEIYERHKTHSIYELKFIVPKFSADLSDLIEYMTMPEPEQRPQSIEQIFDNTDFSIIQ